MRLKDQGAEYGTPRGHFLPPDRQQTLPSVGTLGGKSQSSVGPGVASTVAEQGEGTLRAYIDVTLTLVHNKRSTPAGCREGGLWEGMPRVTEGMTEGEWGHNDETTWLGSGGQGGGKE